MAENLHTPYHGDVSALKRIPGLLNDTQIRELALKEKMITPFLERTAVPGIISYGLSSFGYDARLAPDYQIVKPIGDHSLIDPKKFDPALCEHSKGDHVIVPPHGFLLGHTVETFRVPKDVLVVCLGRSTYARCFTASDTILLHDGTTDTFTNLIQRQLSGETILGLGIDTTTGKKSVLPLENIRKIGNEPVVQVMFSDGSIYYPTADHEFLTYSTDGSITFTQARDLKDSDKLVQFTYNTSETLKVVSVIAQVKTQDVYCLTQPTVGNFALGNGAFVNNCGCIVNVTPLEPEWEGQVTLEISNTTDVPLKVYGNEGICQFLFYRGVDACELSYKDKQGKYMGQRGTTHARVEY